MMRRLRPPPGTIVIVVVSLVLGAACAPAPRAPDRQASTGHGDAVVVASFNFDESRLLGEIYAQALERAGIPVRREP